MATPATHIARLTGRKYHKVVRELEGHAYRDTPYGSVCKEFTALITAQPNSPAEAQPKYLIIKYTCPFALLWAACAANSGFYRLLKNFRLSPDDPAKRIGRIGVYLDDVTPGNVRRPDNGRAYMAIYWTFLDFPNWLLQSENGGSSSPSLRRWITRGFQEKSRNSFG